MVALLLTFLSICRFSVFRNGCERMILEKIEIVEEHKYSEDNIGYHA